jgi:hypothetical protein
MKFLCSNCKAKYQIADEKVAGRTLRMTCRRCKEEIVIHGGPDMVAPSLRPGPGASAAQVPPPPPPSPLGADFQRQIAGQGRAQVPVAPPIDEWHVGINEVPVGPMRREEIARKLVAGSVGPDSLAWREGLDDWLPIRQIPELAILLAPPPVVGLPPPPPAYAAPPPRYAGHPGVPAAPSYQGAAPAPVYAAAPPQAQLQPAQRADLAPIGGRAGAAPQYAVEDWAPVIEQVSHSQVGLNPLLEAAAAERRAPMLPSWSVMFALAGGFALLMSALAITGARWLVQSGQRGAATPPPPAAAPSVDTARVRAEPQQKPTAGDQPASGTDMVIALDDPGMQNQARGAARNAQAVRAAQGKPKKELTDEQKAMLARMGGGDSSSVANLRPVGGNGPSGASHGTGELTADQLRKVFAQGRASLQRCYETAVRGSGSTDTVRVDLEVTISPSGNVTSAKAGGQGLPGMGQCMERTVRMWRFPSSGDTTTTKVPFLFQPGS